MSVENETIIGNESERRTKMIIIRFTPTEKQRMTEEARKRGMKLTELIRFALDEYTR